MLLALCLKQRLANAVSTSVCDVAQRRRRWWRRFSQVDDLNDWGPGGARGKHEAHGDGRLATSLGRASQAGVGMDLELYGRGAKGYKTYPIACPHV